MCNGGGGSGWENGNEPAALYQGVSGDEENRRCCGNRQ